MARRWRPEEPPEPWGTGTLTEEQMRRALSRYSHMRGRGGVVFRFSPMGPPVRARNPEELREATEQALVDAALEQDPRPS